MQLAQLMLLFHRLAAHLSTSPVLLLVFPSSVFSPLLFKYELALFFLLFDELALFFLL